MDFKKKVSQKDKVYSWLTSGKSLTPLEAMQNGMGMRLGAIIHTLRHEEGLNIVNLNKTGGDRYAEYKIIIPQKVEDLDIEEPKQEEEQESFDLGIKPRYRYPD
mgnify:CR=1 FL=1|tara:strand:+ start:2160 stop:2471 length:312 start_codon:yes stop_codon:yes gene_type:complete